jgi:hypothetical protein
MIIAIAFYIAFLIAYALFSYVGIFQLRKADQLDFTSEYIISLFIKISIFIIALTALAIILELFLFQESV